MPAATGRPPYDPRDLLKLYVYGYLNEVRSSRRLERVLATVLFVDIVGSTQCAAKLGDNPWRELLENFYLKVRDVLLQYRGREINTSGDGFLAAFDGPARAVRCAGALCDVVRSLGLEVRCGLHTGECEIVGDDLAGIAVHIGARVAGLSEPGEVLVSQTVRDLVAGSGLSFESRGTHALKGVPSEWHLYRAVPGRTDHLVVYGLCPGQIVGESKPKSVTSRSYIINVSGDFGVRQMRFGARYKRDQFLSILRTVAPHCRITRGYWY